MLYRLNIKIYNYNYSTTLYTLKSVCTDTTIKYNYTK